MKREISDKGIVEAYWGFQRDVLNGDGLFCRKPYQRLMKRYSQPKKLCVKACQAAMERGLITKITNTTNIFALARADQLVTEAGKRLLDNPNPEPKPKRPEGPDLLINGWHWK